MKTYTTNREVLEMLEELTDAAQAVIDSWDRGDLAGAVRSLNSCIESSRTIIAGAARNHRQDLIDAAELGLRELRQFYSDGESEAVRVLAAAIAGTKGGR
jgi:hypothetical protein